MWAIILNAYDAYQQWALRYEKEPRSFASEVLGGRISMHSNERSESQLRGFMFTDAWHSLLTYTIRLTQTVVLLG